MKTITFFALAILCLTSNAYADDWLIGNYQITIQINSNVSKVKFVSIKLEQDGLFAYDKSEDSELADRVQVRELSRDELEHLQLLDQNHSDMQCGWVGLLLLCKTPVDANFKLNDIPIKDRYFGVLADVGIVKVVKN